MVVELDIFSGRPNPRWELDEPDAGELQRLQSSLPASGGTAPEPPPLGYRGFSYGIAGSTRAYKGYVQTLQGILADPEFSVERFLLERLPEEFSSLATLIAAELRPA